MREHIAADLLLLALDELHIREHAISFIARGEFSLSTQVSYMCM